MKKSDIVSILQTPALFGFICVTMSFVVYERVEPIGLGGAVLCFLTMAADSFGRFYLRRTSALDASVKLFSMISQPIVTAVLMLTFFYVAVGRFHPIFTGLTVFVTFIILVIGVTDYQAAKKKETDGE